MDKQPFVALRCAEIELAHALKFVDQQLSAGRIDKDQCRAAAERADQAKAFLSRAYTASFGKELRDA